jgi:hypothetical protein
MARLAATCVGLIVLAIAGCDTGERITRLEKENAELKAQLDRGHLALDDDLQAKCSKDARAWFNENWSRDKDTVLLDFTNHYNKTSNTCFIRVEFHYSEVPAPSWTNDITLWNVYENSKYGNFTEQHVIDFKSPHGPEDKVISCEVYGANCAGIDQFNSLTQPYMNN